MEEQPSIILVMRQAGTAAAFLPLAEHLKQVFPKRPVFLFAYPPAFPVIDRFGADVLRISCFEDALPLLKITGHFQILVTGTSLSVSDDAAWWRWAQDNGIPCTAFVDQWVNYWQRFTTGTSAVRFDAVPDKIAVVDETAQRAMTSLGCPDDGLIVSGTPAFDLLHRSTDPDGAITRAMVMPSNAERLILFACEPASPPQTSADVKAIQGFCEEEVLALLAAAAVRISAKSGLRLHIVLKRHPIQIAGQSFPVLPLPEGGSVSCATDDGERLDLVRAADVVVGMRSMLLLEASLIGCPVLSIQPGRLNGSDLTDGRTGIDVVTDTDSLDAALHDSVKMPRRLRSGSPSTAQPSPSHAERFCRALGLTLAAAPSIPSLTGTY